MVRGASPCVACDSSKAHEVKPIINSTQPPLWYTEHSQPVLAVQNSDITPPRPSLVDYRLHSPLFPSSLRLINTGYIYSAFPPHCCDINDSYTCLNPPHTHTDFYTSLQWFPPRGLTISGIATFSALRLVFRNALLSHYDYFQRPLVEIISGGFKSVSPVGNVEILSFCL